MSERDVREEEKPDEKPAAEAAPSAEDSEPAGEPTEAGADGSRRLTRFPSVP